MASPGTALAEHFAGLTQAPLQQKIGYLITLAALIAVLGGMWMWSKAPDYRVLYAGLSDRDGGAVVAALSQMNIAYRFSDVGGAIMVPAHRLHEVRMKLAAQDLPSSTSDGFRAMDNQKFGTSQFVEQINYQRALEGELARSIQTLANVQSARVHLAINRPSVFVRDAQKPSASVILRLGSGRTLEAGQVSAIVNLVSNSVPNLPARNVTVVDQSGALLSRQGVHGNGIDPAQLKYKREIESGFVKSIETIISPFVGAGNVRAEVTADMDFSKIRMLARKKRRCAAPAPPRWWKTAPPPVRAEFQAQFRISRRSRPARRSQHHRVRSPTRRLVPRAHRCNPASVRKRRPLSTTRLAKQSAIPCSKSAHSSACLWRW